MHRPVHETACTPEMPVNARSLALNGTYLLLSAFDHPFPPTFQKTTLYQRSARPYEGKAP